MYVNNVSRNQFCFVMDVESQIHLNSSGHPFVTFHEKVLRNIFEQASLMNWEKLDAHLNQKSSTFLVKIYLILLLTLPKLVLNIPA